MTHRGARGGGFRGRGRGNRYRGHHGGETVPFFEDRRGSKRSFEDNEAYADRPDSNRQFREDREEIHPDLLNVKKYLSEMKAHWRTHKMDKEEEDIMISNVLRQTVGKEALLARSDSYHLNCNVAEFVCRSRELAVLARFMRAFNVEKVLPQHKTVKIFEALVDASLDYFRAPDQFVTPADASDEETADASQPTDFREIFARWLHSLGLFVVDNIESLIQEEALFTQRVLCAICGKKFVKDLQKGVDSETTIVSDELCSLRNRYFTYLTKEADLGSLICDPQARYVISLSVSLASSLQLKKVIKRFVKHIFGEDAEKILTDPNSFIVVDAVVRHAAEFGLSTKCADKVLELVDQISATNPGIVTGMLAGLKDKDQFVDLYERLSEKWTLELLTKNGAVAGACARFDIKQNDYLERLCTAMKEREHGEEENFIFLVRNLGLGPTFKLICGFKAHQKIVKALDELSPQETFNLACSSHVHLLEAVVSSETIGEKIKLKMLSKLLDKAEQLAVDKFGSRLLDAVIVNCQVKTIKLLAAELIKHKKILLGDRIGKFIFLHWGLKYFEHSDKEAWDQVIANSKDRKRQKLQSVLAMV